MDFSSLVLMEKDRESNMLSRELGSYEVNEGAEYITKMYSLDGEVSIYFDTARDVEEWEYSAVYDLFKEEVFADRGYKIEFDEEEYNPTWVIKFMYEEDYSVMKNKINELCTLIKDEMESTLEGIKGKEEEYQ